MQIVSKHSVLSKPILLPFCLETTVSSVFPFYFDTIFRAQRGNFFNVYFLSLSIAAEEGRTRSAEIFSMYVSLSFLLKKKAARSAENFSKVDIIFLKLA